MTKSPKPPSNLWELLQAEEAKHIKPKVETITIKKYASDFGITREMARRRIEALVGRGELVVVGRFGSHLDYHYARPEDLEAEEKEQKQGKIP